jgi:beta-galactosidase
VRVDHRLDADSRWYTGSGIYRPVHLIVAEPVHIGLWGVYWVANVNKSGAASVGVETAVENHQTEATEVIMNHRLLDAADSVVAEGSKNLEVSPHGNASVRQALQVPNPTFP